MYRSMYRKNKFAQIWKFSLYKYRSENNFVESLKYEDRLISLENFENWNGVIIHSTMTPRKPAQNHRILALDEIGWNLNIL